jgi:hypothetical protein
MCICCKCSFKMFYLFLSVFYLDVVYVSHMLQEYVPIISVVPILCCISVFMLQVASVLSRCCICFIHMFQVYVLNVSSASDVCCI